MTKVYTLKDSKLRCPRCLKVGSVWCGYWDYEIHHKCKQCRVSWQENVKHSQKILPITVLTHKRNKISVAYAIFYGLWTKDEQARVEQCIEDNIDERDMNDWCFFKGKKVVTAWKCNQPAALQYNSSHKTFFYPRQLNNIFCKKWRYSFQDHGRAEYTAAGLDYHVENPG